MIVVRNSEGLYWRGLKNWVTDLQQARIFRNTTGAKCALNQNEIDYTELQFCKVKYILE